MNDAIEDPVALAGREAAERLRSGLFCAEAVLLTLARDPGIPAEKLTALATGFCSGLSRTANMCGALSGAVMGLGLTYGRRGPDGNASECYEMTRRMVQSFEAEFGASNCAELLGCDLGSPEGQRIFQGRKLGRRCRQYTQRAAEIATALLERGRGGLVASEPLTVGEISGAEAALASTLKNAGLPTDDLTEPGRRFFVYRDADGAILGYGGTEALGGHILLRSLVVPANRRRQGIGQRILAQLLDWAAAQGFTDAWMLTTTAKHLGERCGFRVVERGHAPSSIQTTRQFATLCPDSAALMHKRLSPLPKAIAQGRNDKMEQQYQKELVRKVYGAIAEQNGREEGTGCGCSSANAGTKARCMGYSQAEIEAAPDGANLGLGCGNPQGLAAIKPGDVVLDLGSGAGFDCFLAAREAGPAGQVIGVDMTHEMLAKARANASKVDATNVEFRLGEIEHLPVADASVDVVISNCVVNLSPNKAQVFREAYRVLKPNGRLVISDMVNIAPLPEKLTEDQQLLCHCISGAASPADNEAWLMAAGFSDVTVEVKPESREMIREWVPGSGVEQFVASAMVSARKAKLSGCCGR